MSPLPLLLAAAGAYVLCTSAAAQQQGASRVELRGDAIVFEGRIDAESAAAFLRAVQDPGVRRLVINSTGGLVGAALDMAQAIAQRQLDVEVPGQCWSSCANYVFPAGRHKRLGHARAVAWHGNMAHVLWMERTGQGSWSEQAMDEARTLAGRESAFFERIGVDGFVCWFAKIPPYDEPGFYTISPADMAGFGIRHVTVGDPGSLDDDLPLVTVQWERLAQDRPPQ